MLLVFAHQPSLLPSPALQFEIPHLCCTATGTPVMQADQKNCGSYGELCQDCTANMTSCQYTFGGGGFGGGVAALGGGPGGGIVASGTYVCQ